MRKTRGGGGTSTSHSHVTLVKNDHGGREVLENNAHDSHSSKKMFSFEDMETSLSFIMGNSFFSSFDCFWWLQVSMRVELILRDVLRETFSNLEFI